MTFLLPREIFESIFISLNIKDIIQYSRTSKSSLNDCDIQLILLKIDHDFGNVNGLVPSSYVHVNDIDRLNPINIYKRFKCGISYAIKYEYLDTITWILQSKFQTTHYMSEIINHTASHGQMNVLNVLSQNNVFPDKYGATLAAINGHLDVLTLLSQYNIIPNVQCDISSTILQSLYIQLTQTRPYITTADIAILNRHPNVLPFLQANNIHPTSIGANASIINCDLTTLCLLYEMKIYPTHYGRDLYIMNYQTFELRSLVLDWLLKHNLSPSKTSANVSIKHNDMEMLRLLETHNILPDSIGCFYALCNNHIPLLDEFAQRGILPNLYNTDPLEKYIGIDALNWLYDHDIEIIPGKADVIFLSLNIDKIKWLLEHRIFPQYQTVVNHMGRFGSLDLVKLLVLYRIPPDASCANDLINSEKWDIVEFLEEHNILPNIKTFDRVGVNISIDRLNWLYERGMVPCSKLIDHFLFATSFEHIKWVLDHDIKFNSQELVNNIAKRQDILIILAKKGIFPDPDSIDSVEVLEMLSAYGMVPTQHTANTALNKNKLDIVLWLANQSIYPSIANINNALIQNNIKALQVLAQFNLHPDLQGINHILCHGPQDILPSLGRTYFKQDIANKASDQGYLGILKWLQQNRIVPDRGAIINAIKKNNTPILHWMTTTEIIDPRNIADIALSAENCQFLNWLYENKITPNTKAIDLIRKTELIRAKNWIKQHKL